MLDEEAIPRVHPLRQASVFIYAPLIIMDTFLLIFTLTLRAEAFGADPFLRGLIMSVYPVLSFLAGPFWGWMADKYGRRHPLIISGVFTVIALLCFALATEVWHLLIAAVVRGIGGSAGILISRVIVADLAPRKALGERFAALSLALSAAPGVGFAISGVLYDVDPRFPFLVAALAEGVALLLTFFVIPETLIKRRPPKEVMAVEERKLPQTSQLGYGAKEWFFAITRRGAALYIFAMLMASIGGYATSTMVLPRFFSTLRLSGTQIGIVHTISSIGLLIFIPSAILSDRIGRKWFVLFAGFGGAITWPIYMLLPNLANPFLVLLLIDVVSRVAGSVGGPAFQAYFFEWIPLRGRGRASAIAEIFQNLVSVIILPLAGWVYEALTPENAFYFAALIGIFTYIIVWAAWKEAPLPEEKWKLRRSTIALLIAEIVLFVIFLVWTFLAFLRT